MPPTPRRLPLPRAMGAAVREELHEGDDFARNGAAFHAPYPADGGALHGGCRFFRPLMPKNDRFGNPDIGCLLPCAHATRENARTPPHSTLFMAMAIAKPARF